MLGSGTMPATLQKLCERIGEAPFARETWPAVLEGLAAEARGWGGQLIGSGPGGPRFFISGGIAPELIREFVEVGAGDPAINPRIPALARAPAMSVVTDAEIVPEIERKRSPLYREFLEPREGPLASMATLSVDRDVVIIAGVNHSATQGVPSGDARARFQAMLPHLAAAMRLQMRLEEEGAAIALGALDRLQIAAILCDWAGAVVAVSAQAELLLSRGRFVTQRHNRLHAACARSDAALRTAVERALLLECLFTPKASSVVLLSADGKDARIAEICPVPSDCASFGRGARVLVTIGGPLRRSPAPALVELGLTESEAEVAHWLSEALHPREIAKRRGVAVETVRSQIKAVYAKLGVRSQLEFVGRIRDLL